jgi:DNA-binding response OmpR family regulator
MYSEFLRYKGWVVFTAADGRAGIDKTTSLTPDVVLLDLAMPRVDGWTVLRHLRESSWTENVPVVVLSAVDHARDEAFLSGCDAYLSKPCTPEVVWLQLNAMLRWRSSRGRSAAKRLTLT